MRGDFTFAFLKQLAKKASEYSDLMELFLLMWPAAKTPRLVRRSEFLKKRIRSRTRHDQILEDRRDSKRRFYSLMQWLEKDGLVAKNSKKKFRVTRIGMHYLKTLEARLKQRIPRHHYPVEKSETLIMIAFDIPEREKRKRDWIREVLRDLGFTFLQKSLWIGKIKVPEKLLDDIVELGLEEKIEILEISKQGSLRRVTSEALS